jgi:hypothetical protein
MGQSRNGRGVEQKNLRPCQESNPNMPVVQPGACSHYTDAVQSVAVLTQNSDKGTTSSGTGSNKAYTYFPMLSFRYNTANTDNMFAPHWKWSHNIHNLLLKKEVSKYAYTYRFNS